MALVLIVDDVPALAEQYAYDLHRIGGHKTIVAGGGREALEAIAREPVDCVILDLEMPEIDGLEVLRTLKQEGLEIPVIVYTGTGNYDRCVEAIKLGAYGFIDKEESMERVAREVENTLERRMLKSEVVKLKHDLGTETPIIGSSQAIEKLKDQIVKVMGIPSPALITGESGTGKELVAREIHRLGGGPEKPFIPINSAALPHNLIESELFGHERGAFTGANRLRRGAFEQAAGGTLFLDEIGELPSPAQAKLLRVLEEKEVTRVGGDRLIKVNTRVIAATNRDLEVEVEGKKFRQDLYFRLNVHMITVPPLRDHLSDIPEITKHFLTTICRRFGIPGKRITPQALRSLMNYQWKRNNVRELRNIIERMVIAADSDLIGVSEIPSELREKAGMENSPKSGTFKELKTEAERRIIIEALERNSWHITNTARELGLADHSSLLKVMRRHNINKK
jgi:two-component system nitrogen regulation response regulator NtrX